MSFLGIDPEDWFRRRRFTRDPRREGIEGWFGDIHRQFDEMRREMERTFEEQFTDIQTKAPKELVREFGNVRRISGGGAGVGIRRPELAAEREPLADVITSDKEVKVLAELPGIDKQNIKVNVYDNSVEILATNIPQDRKYRRVVDLPSDADIEIAKSTYKNGILKITFTKKQLPSGTGRNI
jgi:HSP20 family protein